MTRQPLPDRRPGLPEPGGRPWISEVGLVRCRAEGRHRLYRLEPARLAPFHEWLAKYEQAMNDRMDRMDDYLKELQRQGERQ
jgi:hypothetical protein